MAKNLVLFSIPFLLISSFLYGQDMARVRKNLDTLCAPGLFGRGASFDGQKNAARFLASQFKSIGLSPLTSDYCQYFNYDINTFPSTAELHLNGQPLQAGKDYILNPACPSVDLTLSIKLLDTFQFSTEKSIKKFLSTKLSKKCIVYDEVVEKWLKKANPLLSKKISEAGCLVKLRSKKLTMGLSDEQQKQPIVEILQDKFPITTATIHVKVEAVLLKNYEAQNVLGIKKGTLQPDSFVFVTAHYDHLGVLGKTAYFPGANDNGSGVSLLLELANYYVNHPSKYSIVFIAFGAEEAGLIGSHYYTEHPLLPLKKIKFLINLDLMGTGDEGMMVVNGLVYTEHFEKLTILNTEKNYLPVIKKRGKAANSDHYFFTEKGVPAFFFYTLGGIAAYHDVQDIPQTLPLTKFKEVYGLIVDFITLL